MIRRSGGLYVPTCDCCGEELPEEWDFQDAVGAMKAAGWQFVPPNKGFTNWSNYCPTCAGRSNFGEN